MNPMNTINPTPSCVPLITTRSGSKRISDKNLRPLAGHPLIAYSISTVIQRRIFNAIIVNMPYD
jgi:CMP-N,N'-diacetyllegionaminic acid synthase